uniref:Ion transport domain-containing protein n=1 Tax=Plectus sambesii TaxID=2011161 RepID=A0A914UT89_9BILA
MGNTKSNQPQVISGMKRLQEDSDVQQLYKLVDMHGGGELLPWMKYTKQTGDHSVLDGLLETKVKIFLYNGGKGKVMAVSELVKLRNQERNAMLGALRRKKGKGKSGPNILDDFNQEGENQGDLKKALKLLDGGGKGGKGGSKYRELAWELSQRGAMGEGLLGTCLLQATAVHNDLAKKLVITYPKLINDIFISEDYYGLSPLHQAIVNEDPEMVHFLLQNGADIHQRCYGAFFCPDDQKASRADSLEHEWVDMNMKTQYDGRMYWGEYPLSFAACTNQEDCFRLLRARKADPNMRDTNGNSVLHLLVIHELPDMFDLAYRLGAKLQISNNQNLTPLTMAAKLGKKKMFEQILAFERDILWTYGDVVCSAYPLAKIDSIDQQTGQLNQDSALSLITYGETGDHLDLLDGLMEDLLEEKWKAFARNRLLLSLATFCVYYLIFIAAFLNRPFTIDLVPPNITNESEFGALFPDQFSKIKSTLFPTDDDSYDDDAFNQTYNSSMGYMDQPTGYFQQDKCLLWNYTNGADKGGFYWGGTIRMICEPITILAVIFQLGQELIDIQRNGQKRWWKTLSGFPAKCLYKLSLIVIIFMIPFRLGCGISEICLHIENIMAILAVICCSIHFLYYCRGLKFVGPFVLMVYKIIAGDMVRFFIIYVIFVVGFSQSFFVIFLSCERAHYETKNSTGVDDGFKNILEYPMEAMLRMFIMSLGEFTGLYANLNACQRSSPYMANLGKLMFGLYELLVTILLLNLLIAMMARTYEEIAQTQMEWKRQWAKVILMLEQNLKPRDRLIALLKYSRPIGTDKTKRAFVVRRRRTEEEYKTEKELREEKMNNFREEKRNLLKRRLADVGGAVTKARRSSNVDDPEYILAGPARDANGTMKL